MKKYFALFGALVLAFGSFNYSHAEQAPQAMSTQLTNVSGTVVDENGEPVIGATITEVGTTRVTATDINGHFNLRASGKGKIEIAYVGYKTVTVNPGTNMNIKLTEDKALLDEVVVVGYGVQKKANLTGAVSNVDVTKTLESKSETDVSKALQGTVPGLTILNNDGRIDSEASLVIRGIGTLSNSGTSTPLYVVDGVPTDNLTYLNTNDIESISVLKDAASTSIYGTRAAFGVVLITTKTAHVKDNIKVSYKNNFAWSQATTLPDYPNVPTQVQGLIDVNKRMGLEAELFGMYLDRPEFQAGMNNWIAKHGDTKAKYREMIYGDDYDEYGYYANWDVPGIMFNNHAPSQSHNISATGNSGRTNFYVSFGYDQKQGLHNFNPDKVKRYNATVNVSTQATDWLTLGARVAYTDRTYDGVSNRQNYGNAGYQYLWRWGSFFGPYGYFVNPEDGMEYDARTMIGYRKQGGERMRHMNNLRMTGFLKIDLSHGLTFNGDYTFIRKNTKYKDVGLPVNLYNTWGLAPKGPTSTLVTSTWIESDHSVYQNQVFNGYFNYNQTFNEAHNLNIMVGANLDKADYEYLYYERHGIQDVNMPELALTNEDYTYSHSHTHQGSAGFFGRINYDYKGIYLFEVNGRYDGSSKFPSGDQWAFFPSFSVGYRISEEAFWDPIKDVINNAKIRASYGTIGNQEIGADMFLETMAKQSEGNSYPAARAAAIKSTVHDIQGNIDEVLKSPNSILALEYLSALKKIDKQRRINIIMIPRDQSLESATSVREKMTGLAPSYSQAALFNALKGTMPDRSLAAMLASYSAGEFGFPDMAAYIRRALMHLSSALSGIGNCAYMGDDLDGYLKNLVSDLRPGDLPSDDHFLRSFAKAADTKRFTMTRIYRAIASFEAGQNKDLVKLDHPPYIRVLGFNREGRYCLKIIGKCTKLPVISNPSDALELCSSNEELKQVFELEMRASAIANDLNGRDISYAWTVKPVMT